MQATYKQSGVDLDAGAELIRRLKRLCPSIGGFGGLYPLGNDYLVAGADGVGTKLKLAFSLNLHRTVGIDLVAMNVNDILASGAKPLFFLDYYATSKLDVDVAEEVLKGILQGCEEAGCILLGGETAEMPGFYKEDEYDLAGFAVGLVSKEDLIDGSAIETGDRLVGIASSGLHSNGFSLVRHLLQEKGHSLFESFGSSTLGESLLTPTRIYCKKVQKIQREMPIRGIAHITGGGFYENIPRMFPKGKGALLTPHSWPILPIFPWLQELGKIDEKEMYSTFNMGLGLVLALSESDAVRLCREEKECYLIGEVIEQEGITWK